MIFLKKLFNFYINSSIHVALAVCALFCVTQKYFELPFDKPLFFVLFYGTITGYNFIKYAGIAKLHHRSLTENLKVIQIFSLICFVLLLFYLSQLSRNVLLFFIPLGMLTLFYAVPFTKGFTKSLRNVPILKIWVIAIVWSASTVILPLVSLEKGIDCYVVLMLLQRLFFVVVLTLPFDIRDLQFDKRELQTIPQLLGVERTKKVGFLLLLLTVLIEFFVTPNSSFKLVFLLVFMVMLVFLQRAKIKQTKYYASFWVEAIPIFWWVLLFLIAGR